MSVFHDEVEIEDFAYEEETETYSRPCPCGVRILIRRVRPGRAGRERPRAAGAPVVRSVAAFPGLLQENLECGEDVATCPSYTRVRPKR
ncbi:diphthamide biosynthesis protein 3-like [Pseudopipra pipra]|uniref:diphthamide biosynthesis protein 3-like n=1 Tax=Pseudopipra pipra TaxID=415032 RepID=UPI003138FD1D